MPEVTQLDRIESRLARIEQKIDAVHALAFAELQEQQVMATTLDNITAKVTSIESVDQSAITLIQQLAELVRNTQPTQEALDALASRLDASAVAVAAAITANTPAAPST